VLGCGAGDSANPPVADQEPARFELSIADRNVGDGERTLRVLQGQQIEFIWSVDEPVTIHVHGYDLELALEPGSARVQSFVADATGRFAVTAHGFAKAASDGHAHDHGSDHDHGPSVDAETEPTLLYLEVHPR
jgi:hypothetical protein